MNIQTQLKKTASGALILLAILCLIPAILPLGFRTVRGTAVQGYLDVTGKCVGGTLVEIAGSVEAYPGSLLEGKSFSETGAPPPDRQWVSMPHSIPASEGIEVITYRLRIQGLTPGRTYGLQSMETLSALDLRVDDVSVIQNGIVSEDPGSARPESNPSIGFFTPETSAVDLVLRVSNHEAFRIGYWQKLWLGTAETIQEHHGAMDRADALVFGCLFIMALYHGILHLILGRDRAVLFFAGACAMVAVKTAFSGQQLGFDWLSVDYGTGIRIAYLSIPLLAQFLLSFLRVCYPEEVSEGFVKVGWKVSGLQLGVILVTPQGFYQSTFIGYQLYVLVTCLMLLYWTGTALKRRREGAGLHLFGFLAVTVAALNDILYSQVVIDTGYYLCIGLLVLILSQSAALALRFRRALLTEERLKNDLEAVVVERTQELERERNVFEHLSKVDGLTHLFNKRFLMEALEVEMESFRRYGTRFSVIMADIDHFKSVNDTYGHLIGDEVLAHFAEVLKLNSRRVDVVGRFGGEEFMILLRYTGKEEALIHAEALRSIIENEIFVTGFGRHRVTASFGVAEMTAAMASDQELLQAVDAALYQAKASGRNRVVTA